MRRCPKVLEIRIAGKALAAKSLAEICFSRNIMTDVFLKKEEFFFKKKGNRIRAVFLPKSKQNSRLRAEPHILWHLPFSEEIETKQNVGLTYTRTHYQPRPRLTGRV